MSDLTDDEFEMLRSRLNLVHFDGNGCGTHGNTACSVCHGPSPMSALEVVKELEPLINKIIAERLHTHDWRVARDTAAYSPKSFRYCSECGLVQVMAAVPGGWRDYMVMTKEVSTL